MRTRLLEETVVERLVGKGLAKREGGQVVFVLYGQTVDYLLREGNINWRLSDRISTHLKKYCGEKKYIWDIGHMVPLGDLIGRMLAEGP